MATLKEELKALLKTRGQGWDRQAEALIAKAFYGDCADMVRHHIAVLERLEDDHRHRDFGRLVKEARDKLVAAKQAEGTDA